MYCVCWFDLDPIQGQGQGHGAFELPTTSDAVHAGGDDRSPLAGLSGLFNCYRCLGLKVIITMTSVVVLHFGLGFPDRSNDYHAKVAVFNKKHATLQ